MISGSTRYARHLGFFGGLGVNVESNVIEKATGLNIIPDDKGGARISAKPTAILAALIGAAIGVKMADATKRGAIGGALVGGLLGALTINATAFAQSGGW